MNRAITDVQGIKVGHYTNKRAATGCTVVLCEEGATGGVDVRGSASGTREVELLRPVNLVREVHAIFLSGGSAFGLDAAAGVMRFLEERGIGYQTRAARVPIVPAAIIYDLAIGQPVRPDPEDAYQACLSAKDGPVTEGSIGAGTGATVGKGLHAERATKGGLGTASRLLENGIVVGALAVVNAFGDVIDPKTGEILAGVRAERAPGFLSTLEAMERAPEKHPAGLTNTTLAVVATNATLDKEQANKMAQMAQDALARTIRPAHTMTDGDIVFALATGKTDQKANISVLGAVAAEVLAEAIVRGISEAKGLCGIPSAAEWRQSWIA